MNSNPHIISTAKSHPSGVAPSLTTTVKASKSTPKARTPRRNALTWLESSGHATAFTGKLTVIVSDLGDRRAYTITGLSGLHIVGRVSQEWDEGQARDAATAEALWLQGRGRRPDHTMIIDRF